MFHSEDEQNILEHLLTQWSDDLEKLIEPTEKEITGIAGRMLMDFNNTAKEVQRDNIIYMLRQNTLGMIMNACLDAYRNDNDLSEVISRWKQRK